MNEAYSTKFFADQASGSTRSAMSLLPPIVEKLKPQSVLDVGCGVGTWAKVAVDAGVPRVMGIDGDYVDDSGLLIEPSSFLPVDLEHLEDINLGEFDLVVCLEVAEHLHPDCAVQLIDFLTRSSDVVLFGAAIPGQGGVNHKNERWQSYWAGMFRRRQFASIDFIRPKYWNSNVEPWYVQNTILYARDPKKISKKLGLSADFHERALFPLDIVHPELFSRKMKVGRRWLTIPR